MSTHFSRLKNMDLKFRMQDIERASLVSVCLDTHAQSHAKTLHAPSEESQANMYIC